MEGPRQSVTALHVLTEWTLEIFMPLCDKTQTEYVGFNRFFSPEISDRDGLANIVPISRTTEALGEDVMQDFWMWFWPLISCHLPWLKGSGSYTLHSNQQVKKNPLSIVTTAIPPSFNTCWKTKVLAARQLIEMRFSICLHPHHIKIKIVALSLLPVRKSMMMIWDVSVHKAMTSIWSCVSWWGMLPLMWCQWSERETKWV